MSAGGRRRVPAAGTETDVTVDGRQISVRIDGTAGMPVVLCSPLDADLRYWDAVTALLADTAMVIRYDRPVDPGHHLTRDGQDLAALMAELTELVAITPPFVLVGASIGAQVARLAALEVPQLVAGLLLVDGTFEGFDDDPRVPRARPARPGVLTDGRERLDLSGGFAALAAARYLAPLGTMPLRVLTATAKTWGGGYSQADVEALNRIWRAGARLVSCTSLHGTLIEAPTEHHIVVEEPQLVVDSVKALLAREPAVEPPVSPEGIRAACLWWAAQLSGDGGSQLLPLEPDADEHTRAGWAVAEAGTRLNRADAAAQAADRGVAPPAFAETLYQDALRCYTMGIPHSLGGLSPALAADASGVGIGTEYEPDEVLQRALHEHHLDPHILPPQTRTAAMPAYTVVYRPGWPPQVLWRHPTLPMPLCDVDERDPCPLPRFHDGEHQRGGSDGATGQTTGGPGEQR